MSLRTISQEAFFAGHPPEPTADQLRRCIYTPFRDIAVLLRLCEVHQPKRFLEIGCHLGATTLFLSEAMPDAKIIACDPGDSVLPLDRNPVQAAEFLPQHRIGELVRGRSNVTVFRCALEQPPFTGRFDGIFVDGDHRTAAVKFDSIRASSMLNAGGFIAWHDVGHLPECPDVLPALESLGIEITLVEGTWMAFHVSK